MPLSATCEVKPTSRMHDDMACGRRAQHLAAFGAQPLHPELRTYQVRHRHVSSVPTRSCRAATAVAGLPRSADIRRDACSCSGLGHAFTPYTPLAWASGAVSSQLI